MAAVATNRAQATDTANATTYNGAAFTGLACGAAVAGRKIAVCVHTRFVGTTGNTSSVTVNGNAAILVDRARHTGDGNTTIAALYEIDEPTGTTCDVVVTMNEAAVRCSIEVYDVVGAVAPSSIHGNSVADSPTSTLNVPNAGCVIACASSNNSTLTWSSSATMTEDYDYLAESSNRYTAAHTNSASGSTIFTFTPSTSGGGINLCGVFAAWSGEVFVSQFWAGGLSDGGFIAAFDLSGDIATSIVVSLFADTGFASPVYESSGVAATLTDKVGGGSWYAVKHTITGLVPGTAYRYALKNSGSVLSNSTGTLTTAPDEGVASAFSFCFGSCTQFSISETVETFQAIADEDALFLLHLGDIVYDDYTGTDVKQKREAIRFVRKFRGNPTISPMLLKTPVFYTWSDHDSTSDDLTKSSSISGTTYDDVMALTKTVYQEIVPHLTLTASCGIAQSWRIGKCAFIMPDCYINRDSAGVMLGATQTAWVISEAQSAVDDGCTLIFLISSATWTASPYLGWRTTWSNEQKALLDALAGIDGLPGICVLEGDAHKIGADDGGDADFSTGGGMKLVRLLSSPFLQTTLTGAGPSTWNGADTSSAANNRSYCRIDVNAHNDGFIATFKGRNSAGSVFSTVAAYDSEDLAGWETSNLVYRRVSLTVTA